MDTTDSAGQVQPINWPGAWEIRDAGFGGWAVWCHRRAEELLEDVLRSIDERRQPTNRGTRSEIVDELRIMANAAVMFSALAVEGFLNYYGVVRLGEPFYRADFERLPADRKVAAIFATCQNTLLATDTRIMVVARQLFEARNRLVHPKTKDVSRRAGDGPAVKPPVQEASEAVSLMQEFFDLFLSYDNDAESAVSLMRRSSLTRARS